MPRLVAAVALAFTPIFLANLVFAERFRDTATATAAFGANLIGAMLGGLAEYLSLIVGYRHLLLVVAALYAAAFAPPPARVPPGDRVARCERPSASEERPATACVAGERIG